jgi:photosystem II stability/assembly factor-like uncharacterized protein
VGLISRSHFLISAFVIAVSLETTVLAQQFNPNLYQNLRWRMIGPHRAGRTVGAAGVPSQPNVFYIGVNNGGVWKTNDYGRTWIPIFDDQPTGSIGTVTVAPSDPNTIYVGCGEGLHRPDLSTGDGVYKSTDAGKTWQHLGLRDGQQIGSIIVDPHDPNRIFVAVLGHPYGPNEERGVYRSNDGGKTFDKVLYKDENTGAIALSFDPSNARTVYAVLWEAREGPWENGSWQGSNSGLFKSVDSGSTWKQLTSGLPTFQQGLGRIGFCVAPTNPNRVYALVDASRELGGLYRSEDAGESWKRINGDGRIWGRGDDFAEVKVDPKNQDIVYSANVVTWKSTDGGQSFYGFKGAPGGDDYHTIWINPDNPDIILLAVDQGATLTVNGGETWSSWYNQPTAQFYHVSTDNEFPYWVYGGQQESGSIGIASRGNDGAITFREWHTIGAEEYGYVAPDPLHPNLIYGGKISRYDKNTGQVQDVSPEAIRSGKYRFIRTQPVIFSPVDPHILFFAGNVLFKTTNGGDSWTVISPDLTREKPDVPASIGKFRTPELANQPRRGVIYAVAPSFKDVNLIWAGSDDGLIHITRDGGKTWNDVTPPDLSSWSKVSQIDASHFDTQTAYATINRFRLDDLRPHIYRTHDGGKTWQEIVKGLPENGPLNTVREDPERKGMLFCGTETAVFVSFNDGDAWQPLRLNMPATSIRDLVIHNDDIVVGTHGRGFWILDDITPLRQINTDLAKSDAFLFKPELAYRVRWNNNTDTPLPPEEPVGKNPPDGAIINYYLKSTPTAPLTLEIFDSSNKLVRRFSSADEPEPVDTTEINIPTYWIRSPQMLSTEPGIQRFIWDLHYAPPEGQRADFPIAAIDHDTPRLPLGPWVLPGNYTLKLTVNGHMYAQPLTVKMDPRVKISTVGLRQQITLSMKAYEGADAIREVLLKVEKLNLQLKDLHERAGQSPVADSLASFEQKISLIVGGSGGGRRFMRRMTGAMEPTLTGVSGELLGLMDLFQGADAVPTTQGVAAFEVTEKNLARLFEQWGMIQKKDLQMINAQLRTSNLPPIVLDK